MGRIPNVHNSATGGITVSAELQSYALLVLEGRDDAGRVSIRVACEDIVGTTGK